MANLNRFSASGNVSREPELAVSKSGKPMLKFGLAVNERQARAEHVNFFDCIIWGKYAETVSGWLHKGQKVALTGSLHYSSWTDPATGYKRSRVEVYVRDLDAMGPKPARDPHEYASGEQIPLEAAPPHITETPADLYDDDIPF